MAKNVKAQLNPRGDQLSLPDSGSKILYTKLGTRSPFQLGITRKQDKAKKGQGDKNIAAVVEQVGFDCIQLCGQVAIPINSKLWSKLPVEWAEGKG